MLLELETGLTDRPIHEAYKDFRDLIVQIFKTPESEINITFEDKGLEIDHFLFSKEDVDVLVHCIFKAPKELYSKEESSPHRKKVTVNEIICLCRKCSSLNVYGMVVTNKYAINCVRNKAKELDIIMATPHNALQKLNIFIEKKLSEKEKEILVDYFTKFMLKD